MMLLAAMVIIGLLIGVFGCLRRLPPLDANYLAGTVPNSKNGRIPGFLVQLARARNAHKPKGWEILPMFRNAKITAIIVIILVEDVCPTTLTAPRSIER